MNNSSRVEVKVTHIRQAYHGATELLVRVANVLENGLLYSAKNDGPTGLGLAAWLLTGLNEGIRVSEATELVLAFTLLLEEDISSQAISNGARALRMGAQLVNTLSRVSGVAGQTYIQIRDDLLCWSDHVELNVFPHRNNGPEALRLAAGLLKLTMSLT